MGCRLFRVWGVAPAIGKCERCCDSKEPFSSQRFQSSEMVSDTWLWTVHCCKVNERPSSNPNWWSKKYDENVGTWALQCCRTDTTSVSQRKHVPYSDVWQRDWSINGRFLISKKEVAKAVKAMVSAFETACRRTPGKLLVKLLRTDDGKDFIKKYVRD